MIPWRKYRTRPVRLLLAAATICSAVALAAPASAQFGQIAIAKSTKPEYFRRDVLIFVEGLDLDESQRLIVEGLFEDYIDEFDAGFARVTKRLEDMRPELNGVDEKQLMKLIFQPFLDWIGEYDKLSEQFLENVKTVLNEQQLQAWPEFRRRLRREKSLGEGELAGEKLNLFHFLRDLNIDEETARRIQPIVDEYDLALDEALQQRNESMKSIRPIMILSMQEQDDSRSLDVLRQQIRLRVKVRDVNLHYIDRLAEALPPQYGEPLRSNALAKAFPQIYRGTAVERMYNAALGLEDLDPDLGASIQSLLAAYLTELQGINQMILEGVKRHDPESAIARAEAFAARMRGERAERAEDETRTLFQKREDLGLVYMGLLNDLLTEDQFASLPGASRWYQKDRRDNRRTRADVQSGDRATRQPSRLDRKRKTPNRKSSPGGAEPGRDSGGR